MEYSFGQLLIKAENIHLSYDSKEILHDINFDIHDIKRPNLSQGQVISLIGRSGIGKTQLFKILAGLKKPTTGSVKIDVDQHEVKQGEVGIVPQNYILFSHRTIYENLKIGLDFADKKTTDTEKDSIIQEYAGQFDLKEHLKKYPSQLSGGQRQRVSIIQQVLTGNKYILLDEPFSGLDILMVDKVIQLLVKVSCLNDHNTLIIVSHDVENSLAISDTAFILAKKGEDKGATIVEKIDLLSCGLAWDPEIRTKPLFQQLVEQIKYKI